MNGPVDDGLPSPSTVINEDGTRVVTEYRLNDEGKKVKVVKTIRMKLVKTVVNHAVAERKKWKKFGDCEGLPDGPDAESTFLGEQVFLHLPNPKTKELADGSGASNATKDQSKAASGGASATKASCRVCKGDHWTYKCPYKDTFKPINEIAASSGSKQDSSDKTAGGKADGKYVPPSMRKRAAGGEESQGTSMRERLPEENLIRISSLSEDTTDADVRQLVSRFGPTTRVHVPKDWETNACRGFAFVTFVYSKSADEAVEALNGYGYDNLILKVERYTSNK